jgi:hypothetical protein
MVARADRSVSDTRAAPTAATPGRAGAPTTEVAPLVWRSPVPVAVDFGATGGTTVARPVAGVDPVRPGLGDAVVVRPVDVRLGLAPVSGGTATTGTEAEVRTVGSWSAIRPPSPEPPAVPVPELAGAEPDAGAALPARDEVGAGVGGGVVAVARGV